MILTDTHIQPATAADNSTGIIDIGKNCASCHRLDFLPFTCEYCKLTYCEGHRKLEDHQCPYLRHSRNGGRGEYHYSGPLAASLFPDPDARKKSQQAKFEAVAQKPTNVIGILKPTALQRFKLFIDKNLTLGKLRSPAVEAILVKKGATGDVKISPQDRIYLWTLNVDGNFSKINITNQRKPMFVLRKWPIGKALDAIADGHKITNTNNATSDARLNMFKLVDGQPQPLETSLRCDKLTTGDTVFLVRGTI